MDVSEVTIRDYLDIADKTFWRMIPDTIVQIPAGFRCLRGVRCK